MSAISIKATTKVVLFFSLLFPSIIMAQIDGRSFSPWRNMGGLEFLTVDIAPQNAALGNAGVANPNGGFLQNPALLASQKNKLTVSVQYSPWLRALGIPKVYYFVSQIGYQFNPKHTIGLSYQHFGVPEPINWGNFPSPPFHQFSPKLYYAQKQQHLQWGFSVGYVEAGSESGQKVIKNSRGLSFSSGISSQQQFWGANWIFAASINDWGPRHFVEAVPPYQKDYYRYLPTTFRIGGQSSIIKRNTRFNLHYQFEHLLVPRNLDSINSGWLSPIQSIHDAAWGENWQDWQFKLGLEWPEIALGERLTLALRLGWQYEAPEQGDRHLMTTGIGLQSKRFSLDAAYWQPLVPNHPLQNTLMFSLGYRWNPD